MDFLATSVSNLQNLIDAPNPTTTVEQDYPTLSSVVNEAHGTHADATDATPDATGATSNTVVTNNQEEFNTTYITTQEIYAYMGCCRATLLAARRRGFIPDPIVVNDTTHIWKRADVMHKLEAWKLVRNNGK